jgi:hypothetical protein
LLSSEIKSAKQADFRGFIARRHRIANYVAFLQACSRSRLLAKIDSTVINNCDKSTDGLVVDRALLLARVWD